MPQESRRKTLLLIVLSVIVFLGLTIFVVISWNNSKQPDTNNQELEPRVSALDNARGSIAEGIDKGNVEQALFVASNYVYESKLDNARELASSVGDELLDDSQLINKYTILMDSYRLENNKDQFIETAELFKQAINNRPSTEEFTVITTTLNDDFYEQVFTIVEIDPEDEQP